MKILKISEHYAEAPLTALPQALPTPDPHLPKTPPFLVFTPLKMFPTSY